MGLYTGFIILGIFVTLRGMHGMDNSTLDDALQEYAHNSLPKHPRTGVLYDASLPSNLTGTAVSIVRLRRDSFWRKGANYSGFNMPPKISFNPYFTRLDIVFSNLANHSSYYYNVPNYTLVAPVVGFNAYGSTNSTDTTKLNLTLFGGPILVHFRNVSIPRNEEPKCVMFYSNGTFEMTNMPLEHMCALRDQGHFSIVVQVRPSIFAEKGGQLWKWWVFGFGVGVLGLLLFGFVTIVVIRMVRMRNIGKMEKEAEKNEGLYTTNVGRSKMPLAAVVRTQPVIENDYLP